MAKKTLEELKAEKKVLSKKITKLDSAIHKASLMVYEGLNKIRASLKLPDGVHVDVTALPEPTLRLKLCSDFLSNLTLDLTAVRETVKGHFTLADERISMTFSSQEYYYSSFSETTVSVYLDFKLGAGTSDVEKELTALTAERAAVDAERKAIGDQITKLNAAARRKLEKARKAETAAKVEAMERNLALQLVKKYPDLLGDS